jgi:hypothetical protein
MRSVAMDFGGSLPDTAERQSGLDGIMLKELDRPRKGRKNKRFVAASIQEADFFQGDFLDSPG